MPALSDRGLFHAFQSTHPVRGATRYIVLVNVCGL